MREKSTLKIFRFDARKFKCDIFGNTVHCCKGGGGAAGLQKRRLMLFSSLKVKALMSFILEDSFLGAF